jgi:hypothetical protein
MGLRSMGGWTAGKKEGSLFSCRYAIEMNMSALALFGLHWPILWCITVSMSPQDSLEELTILPKKD